jgi:hypothetical protein
MVQMLHYATVLYHQKISIMSFSVTFKPKLVTKKLLSTLPKREQDVVMGRFGLGNSVKRETLESIGSRFRITRERVRQIENKAVEAIRESKVYGETRPVFEELAGIVLDMGAIVPEHELLDAVSKKEDVQNHVHFLLVVGNQFERMKEDMEFVHRWHAHGPVAESVHTALRNVYRSLKAEELITGDDVLARLKDELTPEAKAMMAKRQVAERWMSLSRKIAKNPLGEWGRTDASGVRVKNMRDMAYLALKRHGSPMHFGEVAKAISELFNKRAHEATCHNELIKDKRFVLVGRGLYALTEWGYSRGVVKDVIKGVLKDGALSKKDIVERVKRERYVKDGTILVNLQDTKMFKRLDNGDYALTK